MVNKILKNKRGWLRIIEATISIILILGAILIYYQKNQTTQFDNVPEMLPSLLDEIAKNTSLRDKVVNDAPLVGQTIEQHLSETIKRPDLNYSVQICRINEICNSHALISSSKERIYSGERIISTTVGKKDFDAVTTPRRIRIYIWKA